MCHDGFVLLCQAAALQEHESASNTVRGGDGQISIWWQRKQQEEARGAGTCTLHTLTCNTLVYSLACIFYKALQQLNPFVALHRR